MCGAAILEPLLVDHSDVRLLDAALIPTPGAVIVGSENPSIRGPRLEVELISLLDSSYEVVTIPRSAVPGELMVRCESVIDVNVSDVPVQVLSHE
jgi:hypothetical protein